MAGLVDGDSTLFLIGDHFGGVFQATDDTVDRGLEHSSKVITDEEKRAISIHEAGHATVSWFLKYSSEMVKVSIVPRGQALGAAWYMPEERQITPLQALLDQMCMTLGGRAAEEITLGEVSTGALNDLEKVTKMAYAIVVYYGMSEKIPNVCYYDSTGQSYGFSKPYGGERAKEIDQEVSRIINEQSERAKAIITEHLEGHRRLSETLLKKEVMYSDDLREIFGERPWASRTEEIMRLQAQRDAERQKKAQDSTDQSGSDTATESSEFTDYTEVTRADDNKESETTPGSESKNAPDDSSPVPPPYKGA